MGADPDTSRRYIAEESVQLHSVAPLVNWVDPDQHAVDRGKLTAHGLDDVILVDRGFSSDAGISKRFENGFESTGFGYGCLPRLFITAPQDRYAAQSGCWCFRHYSTSMPLAL